MFHISSTYEQYSVLHIHPAQTERDVSVRQRAVDLLYAMCDRTNADQIVGEMLIYLEKADYSIREEMVRRLFKQLANCYTWVESGKCLGDALLCRECREDMLTRLAFFR